MDLMGLYRLTMPYFRRPRMQMFAELFGVGEDTRVLDVGGAPDNWAWGRPRPRVTTLNLASGDVWGDGRRLPFRDDSFDIVFSNSTIEHVGDIDDQVAFACEIMRVGRGFFVQTPNRYFPVEPHFLTPFVQFLPPKARVRMSRNLTVWGLVTRPSPEAVASTGAINLLSERDLRIMFFPAAVVRERFLGVTKSLVATSSA